MEALSLNGMKKLYRSRTNKTLAGVIGGIAEYVEVDATVLRVIYLAISVFTAIVPAVIVYIGAYLLIPEAPVSTPSTTN